MNTNELNKYCEFVKEFRNHLSVLILDSNFEVIYSTPSSDGYFSKFTDRFMIGCNLLKLFEDMPLFDIKKHIFEDILNNKKVNGFFLTKILDQSSNDHLISRVSLLPIIDNENIIGIDVEFVA